MLKAPSRERLELGLRRLRGSVGPGAALRRELRRELVRLEPWYQPIDLGHGLVAAARDKSGNLYTPNGSYDRGLRKWRTFVEPNLPYPLDGRRVLEVGPNAGMLLVESLRSGAREAVGVEIDDHYFRQARFVADALSRLRGSYVPLRVYQGAMENFEWPLLGRFDIALMLQVIYHVGRFDRQRTLTPEETFARQVVAVRGIGSIAEYVVFGANPLSDGGYGKGPESLRRIVDAAGLAVASESRYDHPRGYLLIARGGQPESSHEEAPLNRMISKSFLSAAETPEKELADVLADGGAVAATRYARLRTGRATWLDEGMARLPSALSAPPEYWVVPWAVKPRPRCGQETQARELAFPALMERFAGLLQSVRDRGLDPNEGRVRAFKLVHPEQGAVYQYVDGNQRVGVAAHLGERGLFRGGVPVVLEGEIRLDRLLDYPLTRQLVDDGRFTQADVFRWFDHAFDTVR